MFVKNYRLERTPIALTTLSPLHIGSGEEYEPTGFVADTQKKVIYPFNPSSVPLPAEAMEEFVTLMEGEPSIKSIYAFYDRHIDLYKAHATGAVPYDAELQKGLAQLVRGQVRGAEEGSRSKGSSGKKGQKAEQKEAGNVISRTMHRFIGGSDVPYVPGSTLKGAIHTALLDRVAASRAGTLRPPSDHRELDKCVVLGEMSTSPMRFVSVEDFQSEESDAVYHRIIKQLGRYRNDGPNSDKDCMPHVNIEVIGIGLYRCMQGAITLEHLDVPAALAKNIKNMFRQDYVYKSIEEVFKDLNRFSLNEFEQELSFWKQSDPRSLRWITELKNLLDAIRPDLDAGRIALTRLGKSTGSANFTIRVPGWAKIGVQKGKQGKKEEVHLAKTLKVARYGAPGREVRIPFGWVLLERTDLEPRTEIKDWCAKVFKEAGQGTLQEDLKREAEALAQEAAEQQRLSEMTEGARKTEALEKKLAGGAKMSPGTALYTEVVSLITEAQSWEPADRKALYALISPSAKSRGLFDGNKDKRNKVKAALNRLGE
jgi:CRISPR-associated protein Csm5